MTKPGLARLLKQAQTGDWLGQILDGTGTYSSPEQWNEPNVEIHPSGAGSICTRDIQLGFLGHRTAVRRKNQRRMDNGKDAHTRWNRYFEEAGVLLSHSGRKKEPGVFSGEYDLLIQNPYTGAHHIGEIKTMNHFRYSKVPPQDANYASMTAQLMVTEPSYVKQLSMYVEKFMQDDPHLVRDAFFLFEDTDSQDFVVRWVHISKEMSDFAFKNALIAQTESLAGNLIPPPYKKRSRVCSRCYRQVVCYGLQDGDENLSGRVRDALRKLTSAMLQIEVDEAEIEDDLELDLGD